MKPACPKPDPAELLRGIHAALDLIERNLNRLPWRSETGSHIDLVIQLRNRIIASYAHEAAGGRSGDGGRCGVTGTAAPTEWLNIEKHSSGSSE